ncbi:hydrogenase subunit MbhD domain-containing protein [Methanolacinia paynteri]|uniref:hydrogenase subunit MbhD domain-containing protein n=1 Tax=Methanolacinia paynteri TaxID=230356 RepID=UPI00064ED836|nr:hydrogenase subunit MbhD domain-containing protein [Methanolacinia paynteri]
MIDLYLIIQIIVALGLVISAVVIYVLKDLLSAAIGFGVFSFLMSLEFYLLQAPDVAIAEAAIGAGLTTAIFVIAIKGTRKPGVSSEEDEL